MADRQKKLLLAMLAAFSVVCGSVRAETAVIRATYENILMPTVSNRVAGVAGGVGGLALHAGNWESALVDNIERFNIIELQVGAPCGAIVANFGLGDQLLPPEGAVEGMAPILGDAQNVLWLDYADMLLATDSGAAVVQWVMSDGTTNTMTYAISPDPKARPVRLYWTDDANGMALQNAGPTVQFGQNYRVDIYASSSVSISPDDYQWVYTGGDSQPAYDVWLSGTTLHAKEGTTGKFLLTYSRMDAEGFRKHLGHEVVEVLAPMSELQNVHVGDRLTPVKRKYDIADLFSTVARGASDPTGENPDNVFVYKHGQGVKNGWIWAIRETAAAWQVEIYWKAREKLDVIWPFEVDIYDITWGDELQMYVRGDLDAGDYDPRVLIPTELSVEALPYQTRAGETGASAPFVVVEDNKLYTDACGRFLLRYSTDDTVWFEPMEAVSRLDLYDGGAYWPIGSRLEPLDASGLYADWPGYCYVPAGTAYNPNYYAYPDRYTDPTNMTSSIYGVNRGELEVWWANASRFWRMDGTEAAEVKLPKPIYFPSVVDVYTNVWPERARELVVASGLGASVDAGYANHGAMVNPDADHEVLQVRTVDGVTYEGWIRRDASTWGHLIYVWGLNQLWVKDDMFYLANPGLYEAGNLGVTNTIPLHVWTHIAMTQAPVAGSNLVDIALYIDGAYVGGSTVSNNLPDLVEGRLVIGGSGFVGAMDEFRLWELALTPAQVKDAYDHRWSHPSQNDPLVWCRFEPADPLKNDGTAPFRLTKEGPPQIIAPDYGVSPDGFSLVGAAPEVYVENDPMAHGYNPNEEHALVIQDNVYALRADLNVTNLADYTSDPYVLVAYTDPDGTPDMTVFRVVTETERYPFVRAMEAGQMIQAPAPLNQMVPTWCSDNRFDAAALQPFMDRTGRFWAQQGGDDGGPTNTLAQFYYPNQLGFWYPEGEAHQAGAPIPLAVDGGAVPVNWDIQIRWPTDLPGLYVGDTLTTPKDGLPAIRGQLSAAVVYQQSIAVTGLPSVVLIDPTRARKAPMQSVPDGMKSYRDPATSYTFFSELPPALRSRLYWNGNAAVSERLQLKGEYVTRTDGHNYLLLNTLSQSNRVNALDPTIVTGQDDVWRDGVDALPATVYPINDDETPFDSLALSTVGLGQGYVTLVFNDSTNDGMVDPSEVVDMAIIKVEPQLYQGRLDSLRSPNPLDKQQTLTYTADFAGEPELFEFEWHYADPDDGRAPSEESGNWRHFAKTNGLHYTTVGDAGVFGLSDHYLRCRYRALDPDVQAVVGTNWTVWTPPQLVEGWIKRALKEINPFEQRIRDYMNYALDTSLSMVQQAGRPYAGDVPLNYAALDDYGLIPLYETIYRQSLDLCRNEEVSGALSLALMMVSGRLADFYTLLGNEAYADALNPTVTLGTDDPVALTEVSSIFCFQNQLPDLLSEELVLLRGRDDSMNPPVTEYPIYNRLPWNFTADIVGGEVAYVLNYGVSDLKGDQDGSLDEDDAAMLYPQGHGDAWGHYLNAMKYYYGLMNQANVHWYPQVEGILVGDSEVTLSYLHEKKFARAAEAKARAGLDILGKSWRQTYEEGQADNWGVLRDANTNRAWGVSEWASRVGQGTYFDWLAANSLLPDRDSDPSHEGIRVIDRVTVPELAELTESGRKIQRELDRVDAGLNPLGLSQNTVPFDISAAGIDAGETHFEQLYARAKAALQNAAEIFDRVQTCAQALRDQNEAREFDQTLADEEAELTRRLIELYGYPYSDDIGPGKLYPEGYSGPDLIHYNYIERHVAGSGTGRSISFDYTRYTVQNRMEQVSTTFDHLPWGEANLTAGFLGIATLFNVSVPDITNAYTATFDHYVGPSGLPQKPPSYTGTRRAEGEIQLALSQYVEAINRLLAGKDRMLAGVEAIEDEVDRILAQRSLESTRAIYGSQVRAFLTGIDLIQGYIKSSKEQAAMLATDIWESQLNIAWAAPTSVGVAVDGGAPLRMLAATAGATQMMAKHAALFSTTKLEWALYALEVATTIDSELVDADLRTQLVNKQNLWKIQDMVRAQRSVHDEINEVFQAAETARMNYYKAIADGDGLQVERERLRMNHAADLNAKRYRNMAYHIFRNDELDRYAESFDQAARYCYLAAKAYDYETGLLQGESSHTAGRDFMEQIVRARTIGRMTRGAGNSPDVPLLGGPAGDPGLADILARMKANWDVLDGRLGFNNPQTETGRFSLRQELFRINPADAGSDRSDANWRETLERCRVDDLFAVDAFKRYCLPFAPAYASEPAIVIPFSTDISFRSNFFGHDLAGGDNAYDSTHFATKIRSAGVWFSDFNSTFDRGVANQPRVYLIPVGMDRMRVPSSDMSEVRSFQVVDQAMPVPYPFSEQEWDSPNWSALKDMLGGELYNIRRYPSMRAYHDSGLFNDADVINNSRLIGRSVWNTQWLLIIPGGTLLSDPEEGIERFIHGREVYPGVRDENGVSDIKIFFQTYSYSGN